MTPERLEELRRLAEPGVDQNAYRGTLAYMDNLAEVLDELDRVTSERDRLATEVNDFNRLDRQHIANPDEHAPFVDDGITYCGEYSVRRAEILHGCGEVWPCAVMRSGVPS